MVPAFEIVGGGQQDVLVTAEGEAADVDAAVWMPGLQAGPEEPGEELDPMMAGERLLEFLIDLAQGSEQEFAGEPAFRQRQDIQLVLTDDSRDDSRFVRLGR
jgi:hypothetical protein